MIYTEIPTTLIAYKIEPTDAVLFPHPEDKLKTTMAKGYKITFGGRAIGRTTIPCYFLSASCAEYRLPELIEYYNNELFKIPEISKLTTLCNNLYKIYKDAEQIYEDKLDNGDEVTEEDEKDVEEKERYYDKVRLELVCLMRDELEYRFSDMYNPFFELFPQEKSISLKDVPVGLFIYNNILCFANEYGEYFIVDSGEVFWGGTNNKEDRAKLQVYPVDIVRGGHINE